MSAQGFVGPVLGLPADYFLSPLGERFFINSKLPIKEIRGRESGSENGFSWRSCNTGFLSRIISHGMLNGIEIRRLEYHSKREDFMKLIEIVISSGIIRDFRPTIRKEFFNSKERRRLLDPELVQGNIKEFSDPASPKLALVKNMIAGKFQIDPNLRDYFLWIKADLVSRLLDRIPGEIWYALYSFRNTVIQQQLVSWITSQLNLALQKINLSEELAIFILEYLQLAEQSHFLNLAQRDRYARQHGHRIREILANPEFRQRLINRAENQGEMISFSIKFSEYNSTKVPSPSVLFTIRNRGVFGADQRTIVQAKRENELQSVSLGAVLQQNGTEELETSLLALYIQSLQQACEKHHSHFNAQLVQDPRTQETISRISLGF